MKFKTPTINRADKAIKRINSTIEQMSGDELVRAGLPKDSNPYPDGTSVVEVGIAHEFGRPDQGIPERSFLRSTLNNKRQEFLSDIKKLGAKVALGEMTADRALAALGLKLQTEIRGTISDGIDPVLTSREGTPLIDTGHLRQSIVFKVGDK